MRRDLLAGVLHEFEVGELSDLIEGAPLTESSRRDLAWVREVLRQIAAEDGSQSSRA